MNINTFLKNNEQGLCAFRSIYLGLKCKQTKLFQLLDIFSFQDFYNLILFGNNKKKSLLNNFKNNNFYLREEFNNKAMKFFLNNFLTKNLQILKDTGSTHTTLIILISIYFNIKINLIKENGKIFNDKLEKLYKIFKNYKVYHVLNINITSNGNHVYYKNNPKETSIFNFNNQKINNELRNKQLTDNLEKINYFINNPLLDKKQEKYIETFLKNKY